MKLGISMWSFARLCEQGKMDVDGFIRYVQEQDKYKGVELLDCFWKSTDEEVLKAKKMLDESRLVVGCYSVSNDFIQRKQREWEKQVESVKRGVDIALMLGTKVVRVFGGRMKDEIPLEKARELVIVGLKDAAEYAQKKGCVLAIENHGAISGTSQLQKEIVEAVNSPAMQVTIDVGNYLLLDETPVEATKNVASLAAHVHVKDFSKVGNDYCGHFDRTPQGIKLVGATIGEGIVDLSGVFQVLKEAGYNGYLSLEYEGIEENMAGVEKSLRNIKKTLM